MREAFSVGAALDGGVTPRLLRARDLWTPFHGVRLPAGRDSLPDRCLALAIVMGPLQAFCGPTAARLWGIPLPWSMECDERIHVTSLDGGRALRRAGVVGHKASGGLGVVEMGGLRVTSPADTWCAIATVLEVDDLIAAGDRLLGLPAPLATAEEIDRAISRHGSRRGAVRLREARQELRPNVFSRRETFVRLLIVRAGLPEPEPNGSIALSSGRRTRGDLVFRREKVLLEYDGEHHVLDPTQWAIDVDRLNDFAQDDWRVIRITKRTPPAEIVARTRRALHDRGRMRRGDEIGRP